MAPLPRVNPQQQSAKFSDPIESVTPDKVSRKRNDYDDDPYTETR